MTLHGEGPKRRIDITLERLEEEFNALPNEERARLINRPWVSTLELIGKLRGMEMAEEEVRGASRPCGRGLADTYDRLVKPGDPPVESLLLVFQEHFSLTPA